MTLTYERDLVIPSYIHQKRSFYVKTLKSQSTNRIGIQTDRQTQTGATERITTPYSRVSAALWQKKGALSSEVKVLPSPNL